MTILDQLDVYKLCACVFFVAKNRREKAHKTCISSMCHNRDEIRLDLFQFTTRQNFHLIFRRQTFEIKAREAPRNVHNFTNTAIYFFNKK